MKLAHKFYKTHKLQQNFTDESVLFFQLGNPISKLQMKIRDRFTEINCSVLKITNTLLKNLIRNSDNNKINFFIQGPVWCVVEVNSWDHFPIIECDIILEESSSICFQLANNLYPAKQVPRSLMKNYYIRPLFNYKKKLENSTKIFGINLKFLE